MTIIAFMAMGTEPTKVQRTHDFANMTIRTSGSQWAESLLVFNTFRNLLLWINVQIETFWSLCAIAISGVKETLGHLAEIILVQEFTVIILFAEPTEPVLAHDFI